MHQLGRTELAAVASFCTTVFFCVGLTGCPNQQGPDDWGDFRNDAGPDASDASDVSDTADARDMSEEPRSPSFLPDQQPEDTNCGGGWCWVHPRPFPYSGRELGAVGQEVYGLVKTESFSEQIPFVWGDGFELRLKIGARPRHPARSFR